MGEMGYMALINDLLMQKTLIMSRLQDLFQKQLADIALKQQQQTMPIVQSNIYENEEFKEEPISPSTSTNSLSSKRSRNESMESDICPPPKKKQKTSKWQQIKNGNYTINAEDIGLVKNIKWRDFEKKFVQKETKKKFDGKDSAKWQKISCALAVFTKNKMGNDKSLGSAPWRSTRAVREKC